ncbi:hypothetical protein EG329_011995 [Mollisiaceae sp. DMI_Dod_QoI]|nr:hypothetical protein EG329_011995 [Helotiales sp. DMI_Dod_QoI]
MFQPTINDVQCSLSSSSCTGDHDTQTSDNHVQSEDNAMAVGPDENSGLSRPASIHSTLRAPIAAPSARDASGIVALNSQYTFSVQLRYFHDFIQDNLGYHPNSFRFASEQEIAEEISCWQHDRCAQFASQIQNWIRNDLEHPQSKIKREIRNSQRRSVRARMEAISAGQGDRRGQTDARTAVAEEAKQVRGREKVEFMEVDGDRIHPRLTHYGKRRQNPDDDDESQSPSKRVALS